MLRRPVNCSYLYFVKAAANSSGAYVMKRPVTGKTYRRASNGNKKNLKLMHSLLHDRDDTPGPPPAESAFGGIPWILRRAFCNCCSPPRSRVTGVLSSEQVLFSTELVGLPVDYLFNASFTIVQKGFGQRKPLSTTSVIGRFASAHEASLGSCYGYHATILPPRVAMG